MCAYIVRGMCTFAYAPLNDNNFNKVSTTRAKKNTATTTMIVHTVCIYAMNMIFRLHLHTLKMQHLSVKYLECYFLLITISTAHTLEETKTFFRLTSNYSLCITLRAPFGCIFVFLSSSLLNYHYLCDVLCFACLCVIHFLDRDASIKRAEMKIWLQNLTFKT